MKRTSKKRTIRTWIVEDNDMYRQTVAESFEDHPEINLDQGFSSCEELFQHLGHDKNTPPDVMLMDIGLPGMTGIEGVKELKATHPGVQIIMFTVYQDNDRIFRALCNGASGYLLKNSTADDIENAIYDAVDGAAPINPQIAKKVLEMFFAVQPPSQNYGLTPREKEILELLVEGFSKKKIADHLFVSFHTVDSHIKNIYTKLQVNSGNEAVAKALRENLI
ncbi:MAG: DNA-binding response regulator [Balneolaceae bacterium]|nr:MAG: DNA-binding response regulator [Balneolaceae bacterium]